MDIPTERITGVQFGVMSPDEIVRASVAPIDTQEMFEGDRPKRCGLFDPRMGVLDRQSVCPTDKQGNIACPGYFGHIKLAMPVLHKQYEKYIVKILRCVCPMCSYPKADVFEERVRAQLRGSSGAVRLGRFMDLCSMSKPRPCDRCGHMLPKKVRPDKTYIHCLQFVYAGLGNEADRVVRVQPEDVERILRGITDDDCRLMGLDPTHTRPEWLVCSVVAVPPPSMRPPVRKNAQLPMHDDLTFTLCDIIKANRALARYMERSAEADKAARAEAGGEAAAEGGGAEAEEEEEAASAASAESGGEESSGEEAGEGGDAAKKGAFKATALDCYRRVLQYHVAVLTDNTHQGLPVAQQRSGRALKCVKSRIKGKEGRIRGNLNGKRVNFSARSVITPDPNLDLDELGVPQIIAHKLTFPDRVTDFNMAQMQALVRNGAYRYPGCNKIEKTRGGRTRIFAMTIPAADSKREELAADLRAGDVVHRHLRDGDTVLFNRQPSLHRMSMMAHRVRVLPYETFRLNVNVTSPYNADFDGDEMNMHVAQSVSAVVELQELASVRRQIISPGTNSPVIALVQDSVLGMSKFVKPGTRLRRDAAMDVLAWCPDFRGFGRAGPRREYAGRELLRRHIVPFLSRRGGVYGALAGASGFKGAMKRVVQATFNDMGPDRACELLNNTSRSAMRWLLSEGFSVGLSDLLSVDNDTLEEMKKKRAEAKREVVEILREVHKGEFRNDSSRTDQQEFEFRVQKALGEAFTTINKIAKESKKISEDNNRLMAMIKSGSKGSAFNFSQMVSSVGAQAIAGGRVAYGFTGRTLPHFHKYDDGVRARGFVTSSFVDGLEPTEFFFHAIAGREGLIDTAVKSVARGTRLLVLEAGRPRVVAIGDWVDAHLARRAAQVKHHGPEEANMELLAVPGVRVLSNDARGNVGWHELTAVTRHDPGEHIYRVRTRWGREVEVVASETLLVWDAASGEFVPRHTPDVAVGDRVPVAVRTPAPSPAVGSVDMAGYFPRTEYIHGTDYCRAWAMRSAALEGGRRKKVPAGWWEAHNGRDFVLPYVSGVQFHRSYARSGGAGIRPGCVYVYGAKRGAANLPASFALDEDNGFFVGLFLADGNACGDYVAFAQNHAPTRRRVAAWFDRHGVAHRTAAAGSTTIRGNCTLLARFLTAFVGKGAAGKRVPAAAFAAPESFVRGLLDGYFSGDGHVGPNCVEAGSASRALAQGIARLLARFGVFAAMSTVRPKPSAACAAPKPSHRLRVASRYARRFATELRLTHEGKQAALDALASSASLEKFAGLYVEQGDTVLDEVVSIERVRADSDARYRKVYDVTVPGTLNFELFDGLCVRDTAETGYIQRRMVKAMEDLVVEEDGTVRNVMNNIVQMSYGGDGFEVTKVENFTIPDWFVNGAFTEAGVPSASALPSVAAAFAALRARLVPALLDDCAVRVPLALGRWLDAIVGGGGGGGGGGARVDAAELVRFGGGVVERLVRTGREDPWMRGVEHSVALRAVLRVFFTEHGVAQALGEKRGRLRRRHLLELERQIFEHLPRARSMPGEPVGIIGAQSLGEPATQMSARGDTQVIVTQGGVVRRTAIGPLVDALLGAGRTGEAVAPCSGLGCVGVSDREKVAWAAVTHVSRHPANGPMLSVSTLRGRTLDMTASHSFLVRRNNRVVAIPGHRLVLGDHLPVVRRLPRGPAGGEAAAAAPFPLTRAFGRFVGAVVAEGYTNGRTVSFCGTEVAWVREVAREFEAETGLRCHVHVRAPSAQSLGSLEQATAAVHNTEFAEFMSSAFGKTSKTKSLPGWVLAAPDAFVSALLQAYFDGDGSVTAERGHRRLCCHSVSEPLLDMVALCLARFGIQTYAGAEDYRTPAGAAGEIRWLRVPVSAAGRFESRVGFSLPRKAARLRGLAAQPHRGAREAVPGAEGVLAAVRTCVADPAVRREVARVIRRGNGVTLSMLRRLRAAAAENGAPAPLLGELDQAILADVWWDPIAAIRRYETTEMVYDFTVDQSLQSFMLGNGVFVHNTLNTFHGAGVSEKSNVNQGVPRLKEILRATANMKSPSLTVHLRDELRRRPEAADQLRNRLMQTRLADILRRSEIAYVPRKAPRSDLDRVYDMLADAMFGGDDASAAKWVLSFQFDKMKMQRHGVSMASVAEAVYDWLLVSHKRLVDVAVRYTTDSADEVLALDINIALDKLNGRGMSKKGQKKREEGGGGGGVSGDEGAGAEEEGGGGGEPRWDDDDVLMVLQKLETDMVDKISIGGVPGILGGQKRPLKTTTAIQRARLGLARRDAKSAGADEKIYVVDTTGTNLARVLADPNVDQRRTSSNSIREVLSVLGIEAARQCIVDEFRSVVTSAKAYVNGHHLRLLADTMTRPGYIVAVHRHGINKNPDNSVLSRASFEMTAETLFEAAVFGTHDNMRGVSSNIIFGQPAPRVGTGVVDVVPIEAPDEPLCSHVYTTYAPGSWAVRGPLFAV